MNLQMSILRKRSGLTQKDLAEALSVDLKTIGNWEKGRTAISLEDACAVSDAIGCTPNDLCGWYLDHPREDAPPLAPDESEMLGYYRESTPERQHSLMMTARDSAAMSKDAAERSASDVQEAV